MQITAEQCRAARALLKWNMHKLADAAGVAVNSVSRFENGGNARLSTIKACQAALEAAGIEFTNADSQGVTLRL